MVHGIWYSQYLDGPTSSLTFNNRNKKNCLNPQNHSLYEQHLPVLVNSQLELYQHIL